MRSTAALERLPDALLAAVGDGDHLEAHVQARRLWMRCKPGLRGAAQAALLFLRDHLERVAVARPALRFYLDERQLSCTPHNEVELVAADPHVRLQDPVAAQAVEPPPAPLRGATGRDSARRLGSRAPGTSGDGSQRARPPGRPRSDAA